MDHLITLFKALSDRNRVRAVYALLHHDELCACQLVELLGISGATVSRHMAVLQNAGVVQNRKEGRWMYFRLYAHTEGLSPWLEAIRKEGDLDPVFSHDLERLESILKADPETISKNQRTRQNQLT